MKVLVCGSRHWTDEAMIRADLEKLPAGTILIEGAAPGADQISGRIGKELGFEVRPYPASWRRLGRKAGPVRNQQMLDEEHPDAFGVHIDQAFAYHEDPGLGSGTADMVKRLKRARIPVTIRLKR
jgi:hypothetical protein